MHLTAAWRADLRVLAGYLALALGVTWPLVLSLNGAHVGFANIDAQDTMTLRGLIAQLSLWEAPWTDDVFFPVGYPVLQLTPNVLDHLTGAVLDALLPFPLSDNLWWLSVLTLNGWCAHRLGRRLAGGAEGAGWLCGVAFLLSEPVAREVNLHHAPQAMVFWAPLYLDAVLSLREAPSGRRAALAGLWLAGAGWSYWYFALFLGLSSLPLLLGLPWRMLGVLGGSALLVALPGLAPWLWMFDDLAITAMAPPDPARPSASYAALPQAQAFIAQHGNDPLFWLRRSPVDVSNRISLSLLVAAALGARHLPRRVAGALLAMSLLGAVMVLGPYLRWGEDIVLLGANADQPISLPFRWMGELHPFLGRLTWPERWGVVVTLGLLGLAARAPRPGLLAAVVGLESLLVSANLPVQITTLRFETCWSALSTATGAILELPQRRPGLRVARVGVHRRFHRRPVINPLLLPPGVETPAAWKAWKTQQPLLQFIRTLEAGQWPEDPGAESIYAMQQAGVSALVLDVEPGVMLTAGKLNRYQAGLGRYLGPPIDLGCAWVWWFDASAPPPAAIADGDRWRADAEAWKAAHPPPVLETLIQPSWDVMVGGIE